MMNQNQSPNSAMRQSMTNLEESVGSHPKQHEVLYQIEDIVDNPVT